MLKKLIRSLFRSTGIYIGKRPTHGGKADFVVDGLSYGFSFPSANYAPWQGDKDFMTIYEQIRSNTLVDIYRCYELWQLVQKTQQLSRGSAILEVGVWRGGTAGIMSAQLAKLNSNGILYLADTFTGVAKAGTNDAFYTGGEHHDTSQAIVEEVMTTKSRYAHYKILKGIFPDDTQQLVPTDAVFGLCHIDVDVYDSAKDVLEWVWPKLVTGGIVVFDDYGFHTCTGVTKLVESYRDRNDRVLVHNLNGHALMIKLS